MHVSVKQVTVLAAATLALSAQTPSVAPSPNVITLSPLSKVRHLEYSFAVSDPTRSAVANAFFNGSNLGTTPWLLAAGGTNGSIDVDIVALTSDNGIVAKVLEVRKDSPHPGETFTCVVYGDGRTQCSADGPLSETENVLISFLGRNFFDQTRLDGRNHWQNSYKGKEVAVTADYTVSDGQRAPQVVIVEHSVVSMVKTMRKTIIDARVVYDSALSVPDSIHSVAGDGDGTGTTIDLNLVQDSFGGH